MSSFSKPELDALARQRESVLDHLLSDADQATAFMSSTSQMADTQQFKRCLAEGEDMARHLIRCLDTRINDMTMVWLILLTRITGERVIKDENVGRVYLMGRDWLEWGRAQGWV